MVSGLIANIQRYSLHDGPGIRTTVFLKGCPLSCAWCHNPENRLPRSELIMLPERCIRCLSCVESCERQASVPAAEAGSDNARGGRCSLCGACVEACPAEARRQVGRSMSAPDVISEVTRDRLFFEESGGGVTFSGGEPFVQASFLLELLRLCRDKGISTAVDTCGHVAQDVLLAAAPLTDIFLYDLKVADDEKHQLLTGVSNALILRNLTALARTHRRIWIRIPIIPGINDGEMEIDALALLAYSLPSVEQVNLLPYHRTGIHKFELVGRRYALADITPPTAGMMESIAVRFRSMGIPTKLGG